MPRQIYLIPLLLLLIVSCTKSKEDEAKKLIKKYLNENLNDSKSYEPIEFGELQGERNFYDKAFENDSDCIILKKIDSAIRENEMLLEIKGTISKPEQLKSKEYYINEIKKFKEELNSISFDKKLKCYKNFVMRHKYRAKNLMGGLSLQESNFIFGKEPFEVITTLKD